MMGRFVTSLSAASPDDRLSAAPGQDVTRVCVSQDNTVHLRGQPPSAVSKPSTGYTAARETRFCPTNTHQLPPNPNSHAACQSIKPQEKVIIG